ncbi:hypothetical protein KHA94_16190 [Bacillus sp. FJAT-49705]|uniref:Uncharacterized protein n=1 Tax=Cytobacillus citreus TaxID=2833586 RepID=A0ABS5NV77_9BACI|nr:hypothetical protein [Cytobacillus citreus]MBS4191730.1 hypothetical protein [Cytobacillus citreus]
MDEITMSNLLDKVNKHIEKYIGIKTDIIDNQYVQLLGDSSKVVSFIRNSSTLIIHKKFESFLNGFKEVTIPSEEQLNRLIDYINDEAKAEFVSDTFSKILLSKSSKACIIMGTLLKDMINKQDELSHDHLICFDALINFFDVDLKNYLVIFENVGKNKMSYLPTKRFSDQLKAEGIDNTSAWLTIEKCVSLQIINRYNELDLDINGDDPSFSDGDIDEYFKITGPGKLLYTYLTRIL